MAGQNSRTNFGESIFCSVIPRTHPQRSSISLRSLTSHIHGRFQIQHPVRSSILHTPTERNEATTHSSSSHVGIFRRDNSYSPGSTTPPKTLPPPLVLKSSSYFQLIICYKKHLAPFIPVSYTHLTLPTIYSV